MNSELNRRDAITVLAGRPELAEPERMFARKYAGVDTYTPDGRHAWLKVVPEKIVSWDFRKIPGS